MANENSISSDLIRGHIDTIILRSLYDGDKHGNEICLDVEDKSGGQYEIKQPTLYSALKRLETSGLVNAYWASGVGGRRRYFKLTDEGKKVCEDNLTLWIHSRNVIDKLISDGKDLGYPVYQQEPQQPYYFEQPLPPVIPKFDASEYENYTFTPAEENEFCSPEITDFNNYNKPFQIHNGPVLKTHDDTDPDTKIIAEENESILNQLQQADSDEIFVTQLSLIADASNAEPNDVAVCEPDDNTADESKNSELLQDDDEKTDETEDGDGIDDALIIEPYSSPNKAYSDILDKLFPGTNKYETNTVKTVIADITDANPPDENEAIENNCDVKANTVTVESDRAQSNNSTQIKRDIREKESKNPNEIDYTDIISYANIQGFRVKTSDRTNFIASGKLFINKLIALSSTILYFLLIIEMLALCLPVNDILDFSSVQYLYIAAGLYLFPIITYFVLLIKPDTTVNKLPTMRYCISASFVAVLNLILLTFAVALILGIEFTNARNLLLYIIIPIILYLNIPIYFIIKYILVSKGVFFREE